MDDNKIAWVCFILIIIFAIFAFEYTYQEKKACEARGGQLVRGAIGYACIKGVP